MQNSIEECLGKGCRWFEGKADSRCFKLGVLPRCSPDLKQAQIDKESVELKPRECKWCGEISTRTVMGLCGKCCRFN